MADDADRFVLGVAEIAALHGNGFALDLVGPSGVVAVTGDGEREIGGAGDRIRLAVIERFELCEFVGVFFDELGELVKKIAALRCGDFFAPRAIVESGASSRDSFVDIGGVGFCDVSNDFSGGGVDGRKGFAGGGVHPFIVDEQFGCGDFHCRFDDCGSGSHGSFLPRKTFRASVLPWGGGSNLLLRHERDRTRVESCS